MPATTCRTSRTWLPASTRPSIRRARSGTRASTSPRSRACVYTPTQLDALTFAKFNVLRNKGANIAPVLLHDRTAAIFDSDFTFLLRMNIHGLVIDTLCSRADQYEGQSTLDGLQMTSMKSAMDEDMVTLKKRGYISKGNITISTTQAQQNQGRPRAAAGYTRSFVLWRSKRLARGREPRPEPD